MQKFLPYYSKYKSILIFDLLCASLTTVCELVFPLIVRNITNIATVSPEKLTLKLIIFTGIVYIFLRLIDTSANYDMAGTGHVMGTKIEPPAKLSGLSGQTMQLNSRLQLGLAGPPFSWDLGLQVSNHDCLAIQG